MNVVLLASGRGSNVESILDAIDRGECSVRVSAVISDRTHTGAEKIARARGLQTEVVSPKAHPSREAWDLALRDAVARHAPDLVVLAGFMRLIGPGFLARFGDRTINIHPSLLPAFPGLRSPEQALEHGARITGCTVHQVDAGTDTGPILAQAAVPVVPGDTAESLHARIQETEHRLLPAVVEWIARGKIFLGRPAHCAADLFHAPGERLFSPPLEKR